MQTEAQLSQTLLLCPLHASSSHSPANNEIRQCGFSLNLNSLTDLNATLLSMVLQNRVYGCIVGNLKTFYFNKDAKLEEW